MKRLFLFLFVIIIVFSCQTKTDIKNTEPKEVEKQQTTALADAPEWAKEAIWYQIFPERFRNGDTTNDPTPDDLKGSYPGFVPEDWKVTPWTHDWYKYDEYFDQVKGKTDLAGYEINNFGQMSRLRRYGGDLQGVLDKIDYLDSLGVTAIYFNPLCDAPSDHNYDAANWRHIDRNFGPTPRKDVEIMANEVPDDPSTWQMTGADKMFVEVIKAFHKRGIRVIIDYSWNHTGLDFWAWKDLVKNQKKSKYADWYWINEFDNPETSENEFDYRGWFGVKDLPEIKETEYHPHAESIQPFEGNLASEAAKQHIFNVCKRWLDPNGDGDLSDGVDGYRLDVAAEIPMGFWRDFRKVVRGVNPDAYLLGEIWWEQYPDKLLNPHTFLKGDMFDAVMNYRWYRAARHFFAKAPDEIPVSEFVDSLKSFSSNLRPQNNYVMMNLAASHDAPRIATSLYNNENKYKYMAEPGSNPDYKINKPDNNTTIIQKLLLAHQFTYIGAPHIWAGDEMGMWGADMGDTRKPLIWNDYDFEPEKVHPLGKERKPDEVKFNDELFAYYKKLCKIRKENSVLSHGEIDYLIVDDEKKILTYSRFDNSDEVIAVFSMNDEEQTIEIPIKTKNNYYDMLSEISVETVDEGKIKLKIPSRKAIILGAK